MNKLQVKRRILGLRAMEIANRLGISQTYYTSIETGFIRPKNPEIYQRIAKIVGLKPEELFEEVKDIG
jgi:transcriptional regulator with XRE-family HTH domain